MKISESIKKLRETYSLTQAELGEIAGLSSKAVGAWESGRAEPRIGAVEKIADYLGVPKSKVIGWDDELKLDDKETDLIKKYRLLDAYGSKAVDGVLETEYARCADHDFYVRDNVRPIRYYQKMASAGSGQVLFDGIPVDRVFIPNEEQFCRVAYAVGVNGDSMEPEYSDGDILLIEPATDLQIGEVGIFYVDGNSYVKKLGTGELISLNEQYAAIPLQEDSRCIGRVVGKLD